MTKLVLLFALASIAACGGKKSGATTTSGSAQVTPGDPAKPATGSDTKSEKPTETPEEDPCAVPPPH